MHFVQEFTSGSTYWQPSYRKLYIVYKFKDNFIVNVCKSQHQIIVGFFKRFFFFKYSCFRLLYRFQLICISPLFLPIQATIENQVEFPVLSSRFSLVLCCIHTVRSLSHVQLFVTLWTVAHQAPLSMGFSRQEYWSGLPFPSPVVYIVVYICQRQSPNSSSHPLAFPPWYPYIRSTSVSLILLCKYDYLYNFSKVHIYVLT